MRVTLVAFFKHPIQQHSFRLLLFHLQVSTNGLLSFGRSVTYGNPVLFPGINSYNYLVTPFWAKHDIASSGEVSFLTVNSTDDAALLSIVSTFVSRQQGIQFSGTWMLLADWTDVAQYGSQKGVNVSLK